MRRSVLLAVIIALFLCSSLAAEQFEWENVERIVAVGDIHGAYDNFVKILQNSGLIDDKERWIGGNAHLVQNGDIVDRGPDSRKTMDLLMKLEERAEDAGGRVHVLIGNHEAMNIIGILDLVSEGEFAAFVTRDSRKKLEATFDRYYDQLRREARQKGEDLGSKNEEWKLFQEDYPLGYIEHREAFHRDGKYGRWILEHNTAIKINGIVFSHGDWSEKFSEIGIEEVNRLVPQELTGERPIEQGLTFDEVSPLQYRGLAHTALTSAAQQAQAPLVDRILTNLGATRMVVGHTLTPGVIESRFNGKHISIDVGILELYRGGHRVALEIVGDELRAIHDGGTIPIPKTMDETTVNDYLLAVASVDPTNVDVQLTLVDMLEKEGRIAEAVPRLEKLLEKPEFIPFRYRDVLGKEYLEQGEPEKAREQFLHYIEGLARVVDGNPENVNLANLLARFCLEKNLELELAERAIQNAVNRAPENYSLRLTSARVKLANEEYARALKELQAGEPSEAYSYEAHYITGLAYLGLNDRENARSAFQHALEIEPNREEARKELEKLEGGQDEPSARLRSSSGGLSAAFG